MPSPSPLDVVLPQALAHTLAKIVGSTGSRWREQMGLGDEPRAVLSVARAPSKKAPRD